MDLRDFDFHKRRASINVNVHIFARWHHICCFAPVSACVRGLFFNDNIGLTKNGLTQF